MGGALMAAGPPASHNHQQQRAIDLVSLQNGAGAGGGMLSVETNLINHNPSHHLQSLWQPPSAPPILPRSSPPIVTLPDPDGAFGHVE